MSRAPALRKLLAVEPLYRDEIFTVMGGERRDVHAAIVELEKSGDILRQGDYHARISRRINLTEQGQARAFGGAHA